MCCVCVCAECVCVLGGVTDEMREVAPYLHQLHSQPETKPPPPQSHISTRARQKKRPVRRGCGLRFQRTLFCRRETGLGAIAAGYRSIVQGTGVQRKE